MLTAVLLLTGCAIERTGDMGAPTVSSPTTGVALASAKTTARGTPQEVLKDMRLRQEAVRTVVARLNAVLADKHREREADLAGAYLGDTEGNSRLRLMRGDAVILDVAVRGETVEVLLPRLDRFFRGTRKDVLDEADSSAGAELALLLLASDPRDLFFARGAAGLPLDDRKELKTEKDAETNLDSLRVYGLQHPALGAVRFVLADSTPAAARLDLFSKLRRLLGAIKYEEYCALTYTPAEGAGKEAPKAMFYPGRVTLITGAGDKHLRLDVQELRLNDTIAPEKFQLAQPPGQKVLDLGEHLRSGKGLWE